MASESKVLGFANLPNQVHRKSVKKGFEFTILVVGESGLGKSTLIRCLFCDDLYKNRKINTLEENLNASVKIVSNTIDMEERGVKLKLTVVDTPGFGDSLDSKDCIQPIIRYIDEQFERYLQHESGLNRRNIADSRIHCCFYFISPIGYGLKPIDILFLKAVHKKVNVIPIIAKGDCLTSEELLVLKKKIMKEIELNEISIYSVPDCDADEDEEYKEQIKQIKASMPFAVSSSNEMHEVKATGRKVKGRLYPWGVLETENCDHSDFVKLKSLLVTHMQDLREVTQEVHYENYRSLRLTGNVAVPATVSLNDNDSIDGDSEKDRILQEKEAELKRMQEMIVKMQEQMKQQQIREDVATNGKQ